MSDECYFCRNAARNRAERKKRRRQAIPYSRPSTFFEFEREEARAKARECAGPAVREAVRHFKPWRVWLRKTRDALRSLFGITDA